MSACLRVYFSSTTFVSARLCVDVFLYASAYSFPLVFCAYLCVRVNVHMCIHMHGTLDDYGRLLFSSASDLFIYPPHISVFY